MATYLSRNLLIKRFEKVVGCRRDHQTRDLFEMSIHACSSTGRSRTGTVRMLSGAATGAQNRCSPGLKDARVSHAATRN